MIKSVYHQTVHSTFQYMMRPSLKLGILLWSGATLANNIFFFSDCSFTNYGWNGNASRLVNFPISIIWPKTQKVACIICEAFCEIIFHPKWKKKTQTHIQASWPISWPLLMLPKICYLPNKTMWYLVRFTMRYISRCSGFCGLQIYFLTHLLAYNASPFLACLSSSFANNLDSSSLCPPFPCLSFPVFPSLPSAHICSYCLPLCSLPSFNQHP